jgi:hypothetical protein
MLQSDKPVLSPEDEHDFNQWVEGIQTSALESQMERAANEVPKV